MTHDVKRVVIEFLMQHLDAPIEPHLIAHLAGLIDAIEDEKDNAQMQLDLGTLSREFPTIWNSEPLSELAAHVLADLRNQPHSPGTTPLDLYRQACHYVMHVLATRAAAVTLH